MDLSAALPAALTAALAQGLSAKQVYDPHSHDKRWGNSVLPEAFMTAMFLAANITQASEDSGRLTSSSQAMQDLYSSPSLHKLLAWNLAAATLVKHQQAKGAFTVTAFFESATGGSSSVKQLKVPAYHEQLLSGLGVMSKDFLNLLLTLYGTR